MRSVALYGVKFTLAYGPLLCADCYPNFAFDDVGDLLVDVFVLRQHAARLHLEYGKTGGMKIEWSHHDAVGDILSFARFVAAEIDEFSFLWQRISFTSRSRYGSGQSAAVQP